MIRVVVILAFLASGAWAQDVAKVRAIEYPEVTRLVLPADPGVEWTVRRDGTEARVTLVGQTAQLDAADVSRQIPRTRVLSVSSGISPLGVTLDIALGCGCSVEVTRLDSALLAVDIRRSTGAMAMAAPTRAQPSGQAVESAEDTTPVPEVEDAHDHAAIVEHLPEADHAEMNDRRADAIPDGNLEPHTEGADPTPSVELSPELEAARQALLEEVGIAAADGLIRLRPGADPRPSPAAEAHTDDMDHAAPGEMPDNHDTAPAAEPPDSHLGEAHAAKAADDHSTQDAELEAHLAARDPAYPAPPRQDEQAHSDHSGCPARDLTDIGRWPMPELPFAEGLGPLRTAVIASTGEVDPRAVEDLARYYLHHGFGREAGLLLSHPSAIDVHGRALLSDLSAAIEGRALPPDGLLAQAEGCGSAVDLWRAAAGVDLPDYGSEAGTAILRELNLLPPRLRRMTAQHMVEHALIFGSDGAAQAIFDILDRTPGPPPAREAFLRRMIELDAPSATADRALLRLAEADPGLLELYAGKLLQTGVAAPAPLIGILEDVERTRDEEPVAPRLRRLRALLVAGRASAEDGLALLRDGAEIWPGESRAFAASGRTLLDALNPAEANSLRLAVEYREFLGVDAQSRALAMRFSEALLAAGLPSAANQMLGELNDLAGLPDRVLSARAAFAAGEVDAALALLDGLNTQEASALRAQIYRSTGSWSLAAETLPKDDGDRAYLALLGGEAPATDGSDLTPRDRPLLALLGVDPGAEAGTVSDETADPRARYMSELQGLLGSASRLRAAMDRGDAQ